MRKSTCFTRVSNTSTSEVCENPVAMQLARKLCCCSVGQGWLNPNALNEDQSCERCPAAQTGLLTAQNSKNPNKTFLL